jgi:hypothetical protein
LKNGAAAIHLIFAEFLSGQWGVPQCATEGCCDRKKKELKSVQFYGSTTQKARLIAEYRLKTGKVTIDDSGGARNADCDTEDDLVEIDGEIYKIN